jgi:hypothetical protein
MYHVDESSDGPSLYAFNDEEFLFMCRFPLVVYSWVLGWIYGGAHASVRNHTFLLDLGLVFLDLSFRANKRTLA